MPKITPLQTSFAAGEISPLMLMRADTPGYQQGVQQLTNMLPDSRGPALRRSGTHYIDQGVGDDGRLFALPVNDNFFYTGIFLEQKLVIGSMVGHNPSVIYSSNPRFLEYDTDWTTDTDGNASSTVTFQAGSCNMSVDDKNARYTYLTQEVTVPLAGDYLIQWSFNGNASLAIKAGTGADDGTYYDATHVAGDNSALITSPGTTFWITMRLDSDNATEFNVSISYFGVADETPDKVEFVTPYLESELAELQVVPSPGGGSFYILHELHPPYKMTYIRATDSFQWEIVTFTAPPSEWQAGSYPSCGDFFEGRLWLGGTVNEPQTFWGSKSGSPEDFTVGTNADDAMEFTLAKYGRIEWMVGFKNLLIGTQNGEHIVNSEGGVITPSDIQVQQQSAYGSVGIQPAQVGDQIFYVSADRRKLRAIQYEWQADNWLSRDLTFNSEHITAAGIKHITWHQNPSNLFHCLLNDGSIATLTYDRSNNIYGWSHQYLQGEVKDVVTGPIQGTDYLNLLVRYNTGVVYFETQTTTDHRHYMDSWVDRQPDTPGGLIVSGLDHLDDMECQVLVDDATHPDRTVVGGQIELQYTGTTITVGLKYTSQLMTLPFDKGSPSGSGAAWTKRYNKIYIRALNSTMPLINGERSPERYPSTPMDETQPAINDEIMKVNLGYSKEAIVVIEQDLPHSLIILGIFGELEQGIL